MAKQLSYIPGMSHDCPERQQPPYNWSDWKDWWRLVLHAGLGLISAYVGLQSIQAAIVVLAAALIFITYELNEDKHCHDKAYKDIIGFLLFIYAGLLIWS